jgi:hypothetical protein
MSSNLRGSREFEPGLSSICPGIGGWTASEDVFISHADIFARAESMMELQDSMSTENSEDESNTNNRAYVPCGVGVTVQVSNHRASRRLACCSLPLLARNSLGSGALLSRPFAALNSKQRTDC